MLAIAVWLGLTPWIGMLDSTPVKQPVAVLYAGVSASERERAFVSFLREQFARVASIPAAELSAATAKD